MKLKTLGAAYIRRALMVLIIYISYVIQCTYLPRTGITIPVMLMVPVVFSISMFEKELPGMLMGLLAGALWDMASPLPDGTLALMFSVLCCVTSLFTRYLIRNTLLGALIVNAIASVIFTIPSVVSIIGDMDYNMLLGIILEKYVPGIIITLLVTPPCYFAVRKISLRLRHDKAV